ncbi:MAG: transglycosylase domain-containing protein [Fimbriimonadaceae bacterium]|nr:transglycosylase domain-containing protein [Fimbriimonadaceae bacterium]
MGVATGTRVRSGGKTKKRIPRWWKILRATLIWLFIFSCLGFSYFGYRMNSALSWADPIVQDLDSKKALIANSSPSTIVSADGKVLYRLQEEFRRYVEFDQIPKVLENATLAAEDKTFYEHQGVNWFAAARAAVQNTASGGKSPGASTITMQLAKRLYTSTEKTFDRKIKDMALAMKIEKRKTKEEILTLYLNQVYYGAGAYGVSAAADVYFDKKLDKLTIAEAAMLAGLVQRPSKVNPFDDLEASIKRRNYVLREMRESNWITEEEYQEALEDKPKLAKRSFGSGERIISAPYYVRYILDQLDRLAPEIKDEISKGGFKIYTTLNSEIQKVAEDEVREIVKKYRKQKVTTGAFVLTDYEGKIIAMVGGVDYEHNQYNMISQGRRQPGSAFKPFVYAAAFSTGILGPRDYIPNTPLVIDDPRRGKILWPKGGSKYGDTVSVTTALAASLNPAAAHVCQMVSPRVAASYGKDVFGIRSELDPVLPLVLGSSAVSPLEMARGYSVFMLQGDRFEPYGITRIEGPSGGIIRDFKPTIRKNQLDPTVAGWMDDLLRKVVTGGTATIARSVPNARGKTGTTSENRDAWFCGYTNNYLGIGWVANERRSGDRWVYDPMTGVFGGKVTVQIWVGVMKKVVDKFGDGEARPRSNSLPPVSDVIEPVPVDPPVDDVAGATNGNDPAPADAPPTTTSAPATGPGTTAPPAAGDGATPPATSSQGTIKRDPVKPIGDPKVEATVEQEICVDSGQQATIYCPETVTRKFKKSQAPKGKCPLHGPNAHRH